MPNFTKMTLDELTLWVTQQYSEVSLQEKKLDAGKKVLFDLMAESNTDEVKSPFGRFYKKVLTSWKMPDDVVALKNELTKAEEIAKLEGRATKSEKFSYSYGALKAEDNI